MPADAPTILATSGGYRTGTRTPLEFDGLVYHAVALSGVTGRRPRIGYLGTAGGDQEHLAQRIGEAARTAGFDLLHVRLFSMPNLEDIAGELLHQDVVWVGGADRSRTSSRYGASTDSIAPSRRRGGGCRARRRECRIDLLVRRWYH